MRTNKQKGFTLIELLVVIAIIGILATIVMVSLNTARQKARDSRRISDARQVQLAAQMYYDSNSGAYAQTLAAMVPTYLAAEPTDPGSSVDYEYAVDANPATTYVFVAKLEADNNALDSDVDGTVLTKNCGATPEVAGEYYYCVRP